MLGHAPLGLLALGELGEATAQKLDAAHGVYTLTMQSAVSSVTMPATTGIYAVTGFSAGLVNSMPAAAGSFALTGYDATFQAVLYLTATPFIRVEKLQFGLAPLGRLALGEARYDSRPTYELQWSETALRLSMPAEAGIFTLTGQDAFPFLGVIMLADKGAFTLLGQPAYFRTSLPLQHGSFSLTGFSVDSIRRISKIRAFPRVGDAAFTARGRGRDEIKIRAYGG